MADTNRLDEMYTYMIRRGLAMLNAASRHDDLAWMQADVELLSNVPYLLANEVVQCHREFWDYQRPAYIKWAEGYENREQLSLMNSLYFSLWKEMEPLMQEMLGKP